MRSPCRVHSHGEGDSFYTENHTPPLVTQWEHEMIEMFDSPDNASVLSCFERQSKNNEHKLECLGHSSYQKVSKCMTVTARTQRTQESSWPEHCCSGGRHGWQDWGASSEGRTGRGSLIAPPGAHDPVTPPLQACSLSSTSVTASGPSPSPPRTSASSSTAGSAERAASRWHFCCPCLFFLGRTCSSLLL